MGMIFLTTIKGRVKKTQPKHELEKDQVVRESYERVGVER